MKYLLFCTFIFITWRSAGQESDSISQRVVIDELNTQTINLWLNFPDSAMNFAQRAYRISLTTNDEALVSKSLRLIGGVHYYLGNYDSVIYYCDQSLKIAIQIQDSILINNALNNLGLAHHNLGSYQNALEFLLRSLNIKKATKEGYGLALTTNNVGLVYDKLKDYNKARSYFLEALAIADSLDDTNLILYSQNNIAFTYLRQNDLEKAENYFRRSLAVDVDNKNWKSVTYNGLGQLYQIKGDFKTSRGYFDQSQYLRNEIGDKRGISEIYYFLSLEKLKATEYDSALYFLDLSQQMANNIGAKDRVFENLELYVEIYTATDRIKEAFEHQRHLVMLRDTLFNENMARNLAAIQLKIQEEENQKALAKKEEQLAENKRFVTFLIVVIFLILILVVITFYQAIVNSKKNKLLAARNEEINQQKEEIEAQKESLVEKNAQLENAHFTIRSQNEKLEKYNRQLKNAVEEKSDQLKERNDQLMLANLELDNFIYKSSHDIKGPLATLLGVCNVALLDIKEKHARHYFEMLNESAQGLNAILARLKTISDISSLELKFKPINFSAIILECIDQNKKIEGDPTISVHIDIQPNLVFISDYVLFDLIFFNIIQSVIKMRDFDEEVGDIEIVVKMEDKELVIDVIDPQSGNKNKELGDVFELFAKSALHHRTLGLGLYIVKQSVHKLGGNIVLLDDNSHTHFKISLPYTS